MSRSPEPRRSYIEVVAERRTSDQTPPPVGTSGSSAETGPGIARVSPQLNLVDWHAREKQEQIDRMLEMLDELRSDIVAGRVSTLAFAGIASGEPFCQWDGDHPNILYAMELAKAELLYEIRFGDDSDTESE